jgi:hypothetical protein
MGKETRCLGEYGGWVGEGKLLLETDDLIFRGATRLAIRLADIRKAEAADGWLTVTWNGGSARFDLGKAAANWAKAINNPRSRIDKLDVKPDSRVLVSGVDDAEFLEELGERAAQVAEGARAKDYSLVFLRVDSAEDLEQLNDLRAHIQPAGAIWVIHPKGRKDLSHDVLVSAAKHAGLIDTKTARFSDTHTALKFVIPKADRPK